jgi:hypothetical protein
VASLASAGGVQMSKSRAFWSASSGWTAERRSSVRKISGRAIQGEADEIVRKEARWQVSAKRYLRAYGTLGAHFDGIRVDPRLQDIVIELMEGVAPRLQAAFDEHLAGLAFAAWREWPVASGLSKSMISLEYEVTEGGDTFSGRLRSRAPYTVFIAGQPHRVLIDRPSAAVADRIATDALTEIARIGG